MTSKEALEDILLFMPKRQKEKQTEQIDILKSTIERKEKLEKVWKIVKNINADHLRLIKESITFIDYMEWYGIACEKDERNLSEEQFNLLKEWLVK